MDESARSYLLRHRAALERDIKTSYIVDHMINDEVLTLQEEDRIKTETSQTKRAAVLLQILLEKDNHSYISFYNALVNEGYKDLAALLQDGIPALSPYNENKTGDGITSYVKTMLCEGGVPQRPVVCVARPELVKAIQQKLYFLRKESGWVTIHGMAGCGKSVLAAEALRDHRLLEDCFPGGVHWVSIGKQDKAGFLLKIQNLCIRLNQDLQFTQRPPLNIEEAKDRLRFLVMHKHPRSLVVLDDIWDSWVLKAFDIQCRVLLTSRDKSVADAVSGNKYLVSVESGLALDKGLEVLSLYVNMKINNLPAQADIIVKECKGSPLVVSLIGALLRDFPHRWDYYVKQLQNKQFKRIRKSSSYDYEALDEAMSISVEMLDDYLRDYYKDLSILGKDVKVPTKVLCTLWDMETEEVEDILQEFVNKSLLFCDRNGKSFLYYLHDLQLDFLTEKNRGQLPGLHQKIVHQYQKHYETHLPALDQDDCMYWYNFLAYHMASARMHNDLRSLLFSLDWIKAKTELLGPAHLIHEYIEYRHILDEQDSTVRENFQEFLSLNGHLLGRNPLPDILQLGLCQPDTSEVYKQAKLQASQELGSGTFYLEWVNKMNIQNLSRLVVRPHTDAVYHACFSSDGQNIASCGGDKMLQVFKTETGERLLEIKAHDDEVLFCAFSADDKYIATCSADKKVKVWNSRLGQLFRTYDEHTEQVNCCQFTNLDTQLLLATCSNDSLLKFWDLNLKQCRNTMFGHMNSVTHCRFSPDDQYLASCSIDGTLKIWTVSSANEFKSINVQECFRNQDERQEDVEVLVKCCCWSHDCTRIMVAAKNSLFIFDFETTDLLTELRTSNHSTIQYCDYAPSSQLIALALSHYSVELWNTETSLKVADCTGHLSWIHCVAFSPDGSSLLTSSDDQTIRVWEASRVCKSSGMILKQDIDVVFKENDVLVLAPDRTKCLLLINGQSGNILSQTEAQETSITCCCLSKDLTFAAFGDEDGTVKVLELSSCRVLRSMKGHNNFVQHCQFTPDGQTLISSSDDATIKVWNWQSEKWILLQGHKEAVKNFRLLENSRLLSWSFDGTVKVWNIITGEMEDDFVCHSGAVLSCAVSHDALKFSSTSADKSAKIWSFKASAPLHDLNGHQGCVRCCTFSLEDSYIATGDDNGEIRIWNTSGGELLHRCSQVTESDGDIAHGGWVTDIHFSSDSKILVSTGGYVKWWNVETGEPLQTFYTNGTNLKSIYVSPTFSVYVTIDNLGILYVLQVLE
ncbi:apoptotic protease-activating factor 1 [Rhinatrema bivittatum]|uniref:apoptotic protease-activating factor 1 n=1 Tax=Rhinatrema bivittatum TaxID=194408 RepID=UPI001125E17A|nr:apoptotic protease-activating factor 1 [Rhinatrema bivittatum]XP_029455604.1 apoptotic protease-activating factor 1 [Rhinatrema bivittatum]XP_029455605.1 apoptotic protease-activating factor 1 [Rhinatrema bivittatum]XP_029455606.1 apoptotic protease-activating factor 1 [Rhinatrema bivittatum]XP_029455607.1 apoptotic protease-activating factor 1 [Rhinatrema bivittatum]